MRAYPHYLYRTARAEINASTVAWAVQCSSGAFDAVDDFLNDVSLLGAKGTIPGVTVVQTAAGVDYRTTAISEATAIVLTGVAVSAVDTLVVFVDTGTPATSTLAYYLDRRADNGVVAFAGDGGNVRVWFPSGYFMGGR